MEAEAVLAILNNSSDGIIRLIGSEVLRLEIVKSPDPNRRAKVLKLLEKSDEIVKNNDSIDSRGKELVEIGFKAFDAQHIACAETAKADFFLTTDDKIIKLYDRNPDGIKVRISNPLTWIQDFLLQ